MSLDRDREARLFEARMLLFLRGTIATYAPRVKVADFAKRIGYSERKLCAIVNGRAPLTIDAVSDILLCMGLEPHFKLVP